MSEQKEAPPYQWLLEQFPVFFLTTDEQGLIQAANKEAAELSGENGPLFGKAAEQIFPGIGLKEVLQSRKGNWNGRLQLNDGEYLVMAKLPLFDKFEKLTGTAAIGAKLQEIIRLAEKHANLNDLTILLEGILNNFTEAFSIADQNGRTWFASDSCLKLLGKRADLLELESSIHQKVQNSRRSIAKEHIAGGKGESGIYVRAVPLMLDGKLKGSIVIYEAEKDEKLKNELSEARRFIRKLEGMRILADFPSESEEMKLAVDHGEIAAHTEQPVLIRGEEGTEKRYFAEAIHNESSRRFNPFQRFDCLLGEFHKIQLESKGNETILLENIDMLDQHNQQQLLKQLKEKNTKARFICTTSANLEQAVVQKDFSKELYKLLNRLTIFLPPLRDRKADIELLTNRVINELNDKMGKYIESAAEEAIDILKVRPFPKNIAELKVTIETAMLNAAPGEKLLQPHHFSLKLPGTRSVGEAEENMSFEPIPLQNALEDFEKEYIQDTYRKSSYNKTKTAKLLNISIRNLYYKMEKYHIDKNSMQDHAK